MLKRGATDHDLECAKGKVRYGREAERLEIDEAMRILEKESGLLGVSGKSLDTRVLMRHYGNDERVRLAMEMFCYRLLKAVGAYLAILGGVDAVVFGGGIGENTALVRQRVCDGLHWCGLNLDSESNRSIIDVEGCISAEDSKIQAHVIPVEESLQMAHECSRLIANAGAAAHPVAARN